MNNDQITGTIILVAAAFIAVSCIFFWWYKTRFPKMEFLPEGYKKVALPTITVKTCSGNTVKFFISKTDKGTPFLNFDGKSYYQEPESLYYLNDHRNIQPTLMISKWFLDSLYRPLYEENPELVFELRKKLHQLFGSSSRKERIANYIMLNYLFLGDFPKTILYMMENSREFDDVDRAQAKAIDIYVNKYFGDLYETFYQPFFEESPQPSLRQKSKDFVCQKDTPDNILDMLDARQKLQGYISISKGEVK